MTAASIVAACARRWTAVYTIGLTAEVRDRRTKEMQRVPFDQLVDAVSRIAGQRF